MIRKLFLFCLAAIVFLCCGLNKQARQLQALEKCDYQLVSADSIYLAGTNITRMLQTKNFELAKLPTVALAFLRKDIPLEARVKLSISNPSTDLAAINRFDYIVLIKDQQIANGSVNQKVTISPGSSVTVPVFVNSNIYTFLSNGKTMSQIIEFIQGGDSSATEQKGTVTIKIRPTIEVGEKLVQYPDYITIKREVSSKILF